MQRQLIWLLSIALILGTATTAAAHAFLDSADPKVGAIIKTVPVNIEIKFTQPVEAAFSHIGLFDTDGKPVETGSVVSDPADKTELIAPVKGTLTPGRYEVRWDVVSVDTHKTNGHYPFTYQP